MRTAVLSWAVVIALVQQTPPTGLDLYRPAPADNAITREKAALGRTLFFDARLSGDGTVSCATCHDPERAFTDGRAVSIGVGGQRGPRNVPTIVNRVYGRSFFWDGRAETLEMQTREPLLARHEMGATVDHVVQVVSGIPGYRTAFRSSFGRMPEFDDVARAIATYVRTVQSGDSSVDRYLAGDASALSSRERRGLQVFYGKGRCGRCHAGPSLSDELFHNTGVAYRDGRWLDDGRYGVTGAERDRGAFRTPTLREVGRTAPYMHDGSLATLEAVVDFYDRGGRPYPALDSAIRPLGLDDSERAALVAFLRALTGTVVEMRR